MALASRWRRRPPDLPLAGDDSARYLPWIVAFIVFLAALSLAAAMVVGGAIDEWNRGLQSSMTVQVPADPARQSAQRLRQIDEIITIIRAWPGVASAQLVTQEKIRALLEPWLGGGVNLTELPLPTLIEIKLAPNADVNPAELQTALVAKAPDATVDSHRIWLDRLISRVRSALWIAIAVVAITGFAAIATVVFSVRTGLQIHRPIVEVLHTLGATDEYIAKQFAAQALRLGLRGGLIGIIPALLCLALLTRVGGDWLGGEIGGWLGGFFGPNFSLSPAQWASLVAVPLVTALIAVVSARRTVMALLKALP